MADSWGEGDVVGPVLGTTDGRVARRLAQLAVLLVRWGLAVVVVARVALAADAVVVGAHLVLG